MDNVTYFEHINISDEQELGQLNVAFAIQNGSRGKRVKAWGSIGNVIRKTRMTSARLANGDCVSLSYYQDRIEANYGTCLKGFDQPVIGAPAYKCFPIN